MYPRLFPVHTLADDDGVARPSDGSVSMPNSVKTMQESLKTDGLFSILRSRFVCSQVIPLAAGAYLLDGGDVLFLWLGDQLAPQFVQDLFGVQAKFDVPDAAEVEFGDSTQLASKMSLIVGQLRRDRNGETAPWASAFDGMLMLLLVQTALTDSHLLRSSAH